MEFPSLALHLCSATALPARARTTQPYAIWFTFLLPSHADGTGMIFRSLLKGTADVHSCGGRKSLRTEIQQFSSSSLFIM